MAVGDIADEAGLPLVSGTEQASDIDAIFNRILDHIGQLMLNLPRKMTVGPVAPTTDTQPGDIHVKTS